MLAFDPTLASGGLVLIVGALALVLGSRDRDAHLRREESVREAVSLLTLHIEALEKLDDPEVPYALRELALEIADLLHDPDERPHVVEAARRRVQERRRQPRDTQPKLPAGLTRDGVSIVRAEVNKLQATRPDLAEAFGQCIVAGILSFERMYPECAGILGLDTAQVVASPTLAAERVIRQARDMVVGMAPKPVAPLATQP